MQSLLIRYIGDWFSSRLYDSTGFPFGYIEGEVSQVSYVKEADPQSGYIVLGILVGGFVGGLF